MKKSVLIFGAGINQLELIKAANELDLQSVVIDPMEDPPGKKLATFFYRVAGNDYVTTKEIAIKHKVAGIVTAQMENPLRLMARLADEMGYIFNAPEIVEQCRNKHLMKRVFLQQRVPCAKGILLKNNDSISKELLEKNELFFPLIIKPTDAHSSRGVCKVDTFEELMNQTNETAQFSSNGEFLVEEFLTGREFSVESITYQGKTDIVQITEKIITPYPRTVEIGHLQPAAINAEEQTDMEVVTKKALKALAIDNCASHTELKITPQGVKVIEVGARLGGDFISSYLTQSSTGVSMDKAAIQVALGIKPDVLPKKQRFSFIKYIELPVGNKVIDVLPINEFMNNPDVVFAHIFVRPGDIISSIEHSAQRPACVIITADSILQLKKITEKAETIIKDKIIII
jgi:carbamoyl-phosphate synthase large subunit